MNCVVGTREVIFSTNSHKWELSVVGNVRGKDRALAKTEIALARESHARFSVTPRIDSTTPAWTALREKRLSYTGAFDYVFVYAHEDITTSIRGSDSPNTIWNRFCYNDARGLLYWPRPARDMTTVEKIITDRVARAYVHGGERVVVRIAWEYHLRYIPSWPFSFFVFFCQLPYNNYYFKCFLNHKNKSVIQHNQLY